MTLDVRQVGVDDAQALADLLGRVASDHPIGFELSAAEVVDRLRTQRGLTIEGAWDGDDLVACTTVLSRAADAGTHPVHLAGDVDPSRLGEGIATLMLRRAMETARAVHRRDHPGDRLRMSTEALAGRADQAGLLRAHGFRCERHTFLMVSDLTGTGTVDLPAGLEVGVFDPADADELRVAHNAAFADYPAYVALDEEAWESFVMSPSYARHQHSFVLRDPAHERAIVSYVVTQEDEIAVSGAPGREAHVAFVGTLPSHRGRGIATSLLAHALGAYRDAGFDTSALDVDTDNPTGALGIYERAGYAVLHRHDNYRLVE